jgi:uncharacterized protein involved in exopolysaccharide biosynthesis
MNQKQDTGSSLRDFLTVLFKHKAKIATIFFATVVTVTVGSFLLTPTYEAKSTLLIKFGREYIYRPEVGDKIPAIPINPINQDETVNSELKILTTRDLIERVISALKVENIYPELVKSPPSKITPFQAAIPVFEKHLRAEVITKSSVIEVTFQHKDPEIAASAVNMLVDFYKEKHLEIYSGSQSSFLEKQLTAYDQKLKQSENELAAFKQKNQVFSLEEQRSLLLKQRMDLDTELKNTDNHTQELQKKLSSLKLQIKTISEDKNRFTPTERDRIIVEAKGKLLDLKLREQELLEKYKESNRLIADVRKEIGLVSDFLRREEDEMTSKMKTGSLAYQEVEKESLKTEAELNSQIAKDRNIRVQQSQVEREIQSLDLKENELMDLKREVSSNDKNYRTYVDKLEEARISDAMNLQKMANVSVIQKAAVPTNPVKPKRVRNIIMGIVLGAVSGLGYAFFSEYVSQGLSTPASVEKRLGLPVLATVPYKK